MRIYGKIPHPERGQVLKEVCTLAGINMITFHAGFNNNPCHGDLRPFDRYAKPVIARSPTARTRKHIIFPSRIKFSLIFSISRAIDLFSEALNPSGLT
jgi:hypothetical protein